MNLATIANGPIAEIPAGPLRLAAALGCYTDPRLSGVRIKPGPGGAGVVLEAMTALRLLKLDCEEGEAQGEVILPTNTLKRLLSSHRDAEIVGVALIPDEVELSVRSYSSTMTCAVRCLPATLPAMPELNERAAVTDATPSWLSMDQLASGLSALRKQCPEVSVLTQATPHPLLIKAKADGFMATVLMARLERD